MGNFNFLSLAALVLGIGAALAFTQPQSKDLVQYQYLGTTDDPVEFRDITEWEESPQSPSCPSGTDLPCVVEFDGTQAEFETFLQTASLQDLMEIAISKKQQP